ncbi:hypothetical protein H8N00_27035 [Streptomyces sp. AC563]|nr:MULTISPECIES: hypothetical protein [Streptomyces]MBC3985123.1 hypothetical protein [Streptomyces buecherae]MBC3992465.1 hypothetical protein [Streptomyces buecherae]QNJ38870.1 hypothetical protein H7H31_02275 [Streptomyces buecherae]WEV24157.1 hypothetical protein OYE22_02300 [Streptomyces sp. 71268]
MSGLLSRIKAFASSPQGRKLVTEGKRAASDPRKRAQAQQLLRRLRGRR